MRRMFLVGYVRRIPVLVHWSAFAISLLLVISALDRPVETSVALLSYWSILLVHESGHAWMALRKRCAVYSIEIYPIHGVTRFELPVSGWDHCVILWGGVLAQLAVAVPLVAWTQIVGFTSIGAINAVFALLGYFNLVIAILNLAPMARLDGAKAWYIVPLIWARWRRSQARAPSRGTGRTLGKRRLH
jgi:stage IV sporulation protein FB